MRASIAIIFAFVAFVQQAVSQCSYGAPGIVATVAAPTTIGGIITSPTMNAGQAYRVTGIIAGATYRVYNCGSGSDTQITIFPQGGGTSEGYNDDNGPECGGSAASINYIPAVAGNKDMVLHRYNCSSAGGASGTIRVRLTALPCNYTVPGTGNNSITTCSGTICDPGGTGNYTNNRNGYTVINPTPGNLTRITGNSSAGEACCDYVSVYDGAGIGGTLLGTYYMGTNIPTLTSTTGPLTIRFVSDGSVTGAGFNATISCIPAVSGCTNTTQYPTASFAAPTPGSPTYTISTCQYQQEYNQMTGATAGHTFTSTASIAGTYITVRAGVYNGAVVAAGTTPLNWTAAAGGSYFIHYNTNAACGTASTCMTTTVQNTSPIPGCTNTSAYPTAFVAPAPGVTYTITTCQYQQEYNQMTGATAGHTFTSTASIAGTYITVRAGVYNGTVVASGTTPLNWTATAGGTYFLHYNTNSSCGTATTCMTTTVQNTTTNDLCANAIGVGTLPYTSPLVSNAAATDDAPTTTCDGPYKNMWWAVTGVCGTMTAYTCGSSFDTEIAVFTGSCGSFTQVACNDDATAGPCASTLQSYVTWNSTAGTTYYITAGSYGALSSTGNIQLNVTGGDITPPSITCPATQSACGATMPDYTSLASASDNCTANGSISITQSPTPGSALGLGNTTVTLTATDAANNQGQCTFTVSQPDSDGDNTADCVDGCPSDPAKTAPGVCGCGVADVDADGDGVYTCQGDLCDTDPLKTTPGICGCGVADTDTDSDGTADCNDGCPNDPNKVAAGVCGCGVADVDADGDGVYTCQGDLCDNDPLKTTPGVCGCGVADTDTDSDGTADCNDGCPNDPLKTAAGICGCGVTDTDTDSDGTADCIDGCPNDPNKVAAGVCGCGVADVDADSDGVYTCQGDLCDNDPLKTTPGVCGCGVADTDTDSDGTADCVDGCPNDPNKVAAGQCGCGNPDTDTDGDGTADCNDACPEDPYKIVPGICGCDTPDDDTDSDGLADCIDPCPESPTNDDTDADGTADCFDNCPLDPAKVNPSACGCGNPDIDSDGDTYMDCLDGCPSDPNKIGPGTCGCGVPEIDTDGDGLKDCVDQCPLVVGQPGSPCDDGDPSTENDVLNLSCACTGTPAEQPTTLELTTDNDGSATSWEIVPLGGGPAVCSGSGYPSNSTQTIPCALPDGCWSLRVHDAAMDGMCCMNGIGGYVLRAPNGGRIIDAEDAGIFGATAMENLGFCLPMGNDQLTPSRCDREDYMPSDFIQAVPNPAVQAQYGVGSQTDDGYQFWFFKPNGGYSRRVFITHANSSYIFPSGPDRCSYFRLNSLSTFPLPLNTLLNVRVRSVVNGVYSDFGPACRLKIDTETNCPTTLLVATPGPNMSCGLTGVLLNGSTTLHAVPVSGATRYLFEFSKPGYVRNITSSTSSLVITKWSTWPLEYGNTYNVRVKVSFDNGASYCLFGSSCTMSTASGPQGMAQEPETRGMVEPQASSVLNFWPNPNVTGQLTIELSDVGNGAHTGQVEIISMLGTTVQSEGLNFDGDKLNTVLQLDRRVAPGSYLVRVIVDHRNWTERLVIQ